MIFASESKMSMLCCQYGGSLAYFKFDKLWGVAELYILLFWQQPCLLRSYQQYCAHLWLLCLEATTESSLTRLDNQY